jgi:hypothetical protein
MKPQTLSPIERRALIEQAERRFGMMPGSGYAGGGQRSYPQDLAPRRTSSSVGSSGSGEAAAVQGMDTAVEQCWTLYRCLVLLADAHSSLTGKLYRGAGDAPAVGDLERPWADPVSGPLPPGSLWHLVLAPDGRPERMEARWMEAGRPVELALTCFPDEVMVWRRGAEPASESLALPPGYRLLWPPVSGRDHCLMNLDAFMDGPDRGIVMVCALGCRPAARGGLRARPVKLTIGVAQADGAADGARPEVRLSTPGWPEQRLTLDEAGRLARWQVDDASVACLRAWAAA